MSRFSVIYNIYRCFKLMALKLFYRNGHICQSIQFFISLRKQIIGTSGTCIWYTNMQLLVSIGYIFFIVNLFIQGFYRLNVNYQLTSSMFNSAVKTTKIKAPRNLFSYEGKCCKHFWCRVNKCMCSFYL